MIRRAAVKIVVKMLQSMTAARMLEYKGFDSFGPRSDLIGSVFPGLMIITIVVVTLLTMRCSEMVNVKVF